jgi:hypothetical protein
LAILGTLHNGLGDRGKLQMAQKKIRQNLLAVAYRGKPLGLTVGISRTSQRDMQRSAKPLREVPQSAN